MLDKAFFHYLNPRMRGPFLVYSMIMFSSKYYLLLKYLPIAHWVYPLKAAYSVTMNIFR